MDVLNKLVNASADLSARDQGMKFWQFFTMFLEKRYKELGHTESAENIHTLSEIMATARKGIRVFKFFDFIQSLLLVTHPDPVYKKILQLAHMNYLLFFISDNIAFFREIGQLKGTGMTQAGADRMACRAWLAMPIIELTTTFYQLKFHSLTPAQKFFLYRSMVRCVGDIVAASQFTGHFKQLTGYEYNPKIAGLGGSVAAGIAFIEIWERLNPPRDTKTVVMIQ
eukprot:gb/GEZN01018138.1/.p1 GENE.gb/GEZN01018138.1/~~gb/GEZN01018138.1/.p1  ORF type:complete len:242 (+),score=28.08 gb/GEZN01018138.1/:54-728(+)